jgi:hypothetical protein
MSNGHGGKRPNSGRDRVPVETILLIGTACTELQRSRALDLAMSKRDEQPAYRTKLHAGITHRKLMDAARRKPLAERAGIIEREVLRGRKRPDDRPGITRIDLVKTSRKAICEEIGKRFHMSWHTVDGHWYRYNQWLARSRVDLPNPPDDPAAWDEWQAAQLARIIPPV